MINAFSIGFVLVLLIATYFIGGAFERHHFALIREREKKYRRFPVVTFERVPEDWTVESTCLAQGSVVISVDYFKRFVAFLRGIFGGRLTTYEPLLDRARREALLRMIEDARGQGCDAIINVRLETSRIANADDSRRERLAGIEMLAYGTGIRVPRGIELSRR